ncbi:MAG: hypothetical protein HYT42_01530 [Candidatus Sungbacteria bacterium]|nr:hypothetical protein [Candidatus Sungbacteria bacterium]
MAPNQDGTILKSVVPIVLATLLLAVILSVAADRVTAQTSPGATARSSSDVVRSSNETTRGSVDVTRPGINPADYLFNLYVWFLGLAGIAALFALVRGGLMYMFEGASITAAGEAKKHIKNGVLVLLIAATSYLLLKAINPDLVTHGFDISNLVERAVQSVGQ